MADKFIKNVSLGAALDFSKINCQELVLSQFYLYKKSSFF
jgi:hypothetical protein